MNKEINIYLDESAHLKYDGQRAMILGFISCDIKKVREISENIRALKIKYNIPNFAEIKWHKVSKSREDFYIKLLEFFFDEKNLNYNVVIFAKKDLYRQDHTKYKQTYDEWTYRMCFRALNIIDTQNTYNIYLDKRQSYSTDKLVKLKKSLSERYDIKILQNIQSHQSELMQLTDFLNGIVGYYHRGFYDKSGASETKQKLIKFMLKNKIKLDEPTKKKGAKVDLSFWEPHNE